MKTEYFLEDRKILTRTIKIAAVLALALLALTLLAGISGDAVQAASPLWRDDFDAKPLDPAWYWVNENPDKWNLTEQPGFLRIYASPDGTGDENLLLRSITETDFMIKTRLLFEPDTNFQFAGLVIYQDQDNFLQFGRAFCDIPDVCVGNGIYFDRIAGGNRIDGNFATPVDDPSEALLRLERRGEMVKAFYSGDDGISWYEFGTHWIPPDFQVNGVGLTASQDRNTPEWDIPADFDFFELSEGGGFLPEGYHDYDQGDVPSWACNAGGWAADPDDRAARVNVEIVVDHQTVANLVAEEFRQDLLDAGVCEGGNCSFSTSLWDVISSYEAHTVAAWAQDTSGEWVLLSNSAKTLTCRTYDIYGFDPLTSETRPITNLPETHEFNPRWSPDSQKIVHDTWLTDWSAHGIYITDVKTGASGPLAGGEGGSYPTWSPNGRWIAFDRGADGDYRLFIVPPSGGDPRLVREDAFMASWAPNGRRLAFHQPSDGSLRAVDLNGENATMVAEQGNGPAWSPDGRWIAFERDGDLWKVSVDFHGNPRGKSVRLTSGVAWEGRPTWSRDGKTIAYHAGIGQDTDIWTIPAAGGEATWLTGAPEFGDYDPNYSNNGRTLAYASFSPAGQAARLWVAAFSYDPPAGTFAEGAHPYHFDFEWSAPEPGSWSGQEGEFDISPGAPIYNGYVLLRGARELRGFGSPEGLTCEEVGEINPTQLTRFLIGWLPDYGEITYPEAKAHFKSITAWAAWDEDTRAKLTRHEILPFRPDEWFQYVCGFTAGPPAMGLRVNYGHDWVESFYEAGHEVVITVTESDGATVKATATAFTEPKEFWGGETGFQTVPEEWSPGLPDLQPYDWVYAQVDNGVMAQVQLGDIQGEVKVLDDSITGTILAPWIAEPAPVECLDWGSGGDPVNKDAGLVNLNGADPYFCGWDPVTEWDVQPWQDIGVGYVTPDGHWVANAFRAEHWMAMWTYDLLANFWTEGEYSYTFQWAYTYPEPGGMTMDPRAMLVSSTTNGGDTPIYPGFTLIQPWSAAPQLAWTGSSCETVPVVHPGQPTRFVWGWVNDYSMNYEEALAHFNSFTVEAFWDGGTPGSAEAGLSAQLTMRELLPFEGVDARWAYRCSLTEHP